MWSLSDCIPWMTVGIVQSVAIVTLNLCTIIVFKRNRNLRKRSTYLVINLTVTDMLIGGFGVFDMFYFSGVMCNLLKWFSNKYRTFIIRVLRGVFLFGSFINIAIIALERVHATFFPFRHRVLKECVYGLIIGVVWVTSGLISIAYEFFEATVIHAYFFLAIFLICLLIMCVSYTSIVIKIRCSTQPQHHGAAIRERKLTMTLLIVTAVSLLLCLPYAVFRYVSLSNFKISMSTSEFIRLNHALVVLFFANSLANPILYAIRMPEYRSAFLALFRKPQQQRQDAVFPLREM